MKTIDGINYYEQGDVDNIVGKAKESLASKYEKTHIELKNYQDLENKFKTLELDNKKTSFKETFKQHGGNLETYDDFIKLNENLLSMEQKDLETNLKEMQNTKKYFFNQDSATVTPNLLDKPNDANVFKDESKDEKLVDGTIYKQNVWNY